MDFIPPRIWEFGGGADYAHHISACPPGSENLTASLIIDRPHSIVSGLICVSRFVFWTFFQKTFLALCSHHRHRHHVEFIFTKLNPATTEIISLSLSVSLYLALSLLLLGIEGIYIWRTNRQENIRFPFYQENPAPIEIISLSFALCLYFSLSLSF